MARNGADWAFLLLLEPVDFSRGLFSELARAFKTQWPKKF